MFSSKRNYTKKLYIEESNFKFPWTICVFERSRIKYLVYFPNEIYENDDSEPAWVIILQHFLTCFLLLTSNSVVYEHILNLTYISLFDFVLIELKMISEPMVLESSHWVQDFAGVTAGSKIIFFFALQRKMYNPGAFILASFCFFWIIFVPPIQKTRVTRHFRAEISNFLLIKFWVPSWHLLLPR